MRKQIATHIFEYDPNSSHNISSGYNVGQEWINTLSGNKFYHKTDGVWINVISVKEDIPFDFFASTSAVGSYITYKTDIYRRLEIAPLVDVDIINLNEILRDDQRPNNIIIIGNFVSPETPAIIIVLEECKIIDNILIAEKVTSNYLPNYKIHGSIFNIIKYTIYSVIIKII